MSIVAATTPPLGSTAAKAINHHPTKPTGEKVYELPKTGMTVMTIGAVAVARPLFALGIAGALLAVGIALRVTGRRRNLTA